MSRELLERAGFFGTNNLAAQRLSRLGGPEAPKRPGAFKKTLALRFRMSRELLERTGFFGTDNLAPQRLSRLGGPEAPKRPGALKKAQL